MTSGWRTHLLANLAVALTFGTFALAALRVFWWVGFDIPVALAVLGVVDRVSVLTSTLLLVVIALAPVAILIAVGSGALRPALTMKASNAGIAWASVAALSLLTPVALFMVPAAGLLALLLALGALWLWRFLSRRVPKWREAREREQAAHSATPEAAEAWNRRLRIDGQFFFAAAMVPMLASTLGQAWMPAESIQLEGSPKPVAAFVIGEQAGFTLLVDSRRHAEWVLTGTIQSRQLCATVGSSGLWNTTIPRLLVPSALAPCPEYE
ncbi:MAG: hypothetical protein AB7I24_12550 [Candidatus Nanopelagicales bacterium]